MIDEKTTTQETTRFALSAQVQARAPHLLPMCYSLLELARRLEVEPKLVRVWMAYGMPQQRDHKGRVWIDGIAFARWVRRVCRRRHRLRLAQDQVFCLRCRKVVTVVPSETKGQGRRRWLEGDCPTCGKLIRRTVGKQRKHRQNDR